VHSSHRWIIRTPFTVLLIVDSNRMNYDIQLLCIIFTVLNQIHFLFIHTWLRCGCWLTILYIVSIHCFTFPEHLSSPPILSGVRVTRSLVLCVCFGDRCLSFCSFSIVLSVFRYTYSDYPFGICNLFLDIIFVIHWIMGSGYVTVFSFQRTRYINTLVYNFQRNYCTRLFFPC